MGHFNEYLSWRLGSLISLQFTGTGIVRGCYTACINCACPVAEGADINVTEGELYLFLGPTHGTTCRLLCVAPPNKFNGKSKSSCLRKMSVTTTIRCCCAIFMLFWRRLRIFGFSPSLTWLLLKKQTFSQNVLKLFCALFYVQPTFLFFFLSLPPRK